MRINPVHIEILAAELKKANPNRVPLEYEALLLERFIHALFFKSSTIRNITHGKANMWHDYAWVHQARRDRSNQKALKKALAHGEMHFNGKPIGSPSEPCVYLCSRAEAWALLREVTSLATRDVAGVPLPDLYKLGELLGLPENPYADNGSAIAPW